MYCSPWPRGCTWELAVLKDSEAKQSCYLLRSAPLGSFSPVLLPGPPTAQAAGLGRLPTPQPRGLSSSPDRVEGPPVPGLSQRCCLCLAPSTTRVSALAAPRARSTTRAARSRCPHRRRSPPGLRPVCTGRRRKQSLSQHLGDARGTQAPPATGRPTGPGVPRDVYSRRFLPPGRFSRWGLPPARGCCLTREGLGREGPDSP